MTDREKAVVMAYTGVCMLTGYKFRIFHKYVEKIMGRPILTHEMGILSKEIKEKAKADFLALCKDEHSSELLDQESCEDCVSRAEVIKNIKSAHIDFSVKSTIDFTKHKREVQEIINGVLDAQIKEINNMPRVQPKVEQETYKGER